MSANRLLLLESENLDARVKDLHQRLASDEKLRRFWVQDPAKVVATAIFPDKRINAAELNRGNRLLYSLLSNARFMEWAQDYQGKLVERATEATNIDDEEEALRTYLAVTDRSAILADLAAGIAESADSELIASLTFRPDAGVTLDVAVDIETSIYAVAVAAAFAVAFAAVFLAKAPDLAAVSRLDLQAVTRQLAAELEQRAQEVRTTGELVNWRGKNSGFIR